jgi:CBS domain-containing protein
LLAGTPWFQLRFAMFYLGGLNLFLGFFNLLPAFPMDGGRILRALLTPRMGLVRATRFAATVGKAFAVLFAVWGLYTMNVLLMVIAVFVYMGAESEKRAAMVKSLIGQLRVRDVMSPPPAIGAPAVLPDDDAANALRIMNETNAAQLAVIAEDGSVVGSIDRDDILRGLKLGERDDRPQPHGQRFSRPWRSEPSHPPRSGD